MYGQVEVSTAGKAIKDVMECDCRIVEGKMWSLGEGRAEKTPSPCADLCVSTTNERRHAMSKECYDSRQSWALLCAR